MAWRFRRSAKLGPFRLNFSKSGIGYSVGGKGFRVGRSADGRRYTSASIPGTGLYNRQYSSSSHRAAASRVPASTGGSGSATSRQTKYIAFGAIVAFTGFIVAFSALQEGLIAIAIGGGIIALAIAYKRPRFERALRDAQNYLEEERPQEALDRLLPFESHFSDDGKLLLELGLAYEGTRQKDPSEHAFRKLHEKMNNSITAYLYAKSLRENGKPRDALALLQKTDPEEAIAAAHYTTLGGCFSDMGDFDAAIDAFKRGPLQKRKLDDDLLGLHLALGEAYEKLGDRKAALKEYQKVKSVDIGFEDVEDRIQRLTSASE